MSETEPPATFPGRTGSCSQGVATPNCGEEGNTPCVQAQTPVTASRGRGGERLIGKLSRPLSLSPGLFIRSWLRIGRGYEELARARGILTPEALVAEGGQGEQISWGSRVAAWHAEWTLGDSAIPVFVKRYSVAKSPMRYWGRLCKGTWEALNAARLKAAGVNTPDVIAVGEIRSWGIPRCGVIVTRGIERATRLDVLLESPTPPTPGERHQLVIALAEAVAKAHRVNMAHRDLKARNVLIRPGNPGAVPEVFWIDCPRGVWLPLRNRRNSIRDLSDLLKTLVLHVEREDVDTFFSVYAAGAGDTCDEQAVRDAVVARLRRKHVLSAERVARSG